jgi:cytochrome d ubiquinol oxidase subunit II
MEPSLLALFWVGVIAASILIYVILDGFDLGVGILFGTTRDEQHREGMMASIAPFWDGNETWLVVIGASLFAAFPAVYAVFLGAFYLPVLLMLIGLIFRGVAFEFRSRSVAMRRFWDRGFFLGSVVVAFVQGAAVGALMRGLPVSQNQFAGGSLDWLHPFPVLTGLGLVAGYALHGAGWLVLKTEGRLHDWARARVGWLALAVFALLAPAVAVALSIDVSAGLVEAGARMRGASLVFPAVAFAALLGVAASARRRGDRLPFALSALFFVAAFATLAVMMWPYMIPYTLTVGDAAAPEASLRFFFYGGAVVLPVIAAYTVWVYRVFRGKAGTGGY